MTAHRGTAASAHSRAATPAPASSASATSVCRWRSSSPRRADGCTGIDLDARKVDAINRGESYIPDVPSADVRALLARRAGCRRRPTSQRRRRRSTRSTSACRRRCARRRTPTCPTSSRRSKRSPSTCIRACSSSSSRRPIRARPTNSCSRSSRRAGLKAGDDFFLAFSPERVDPGNAKFNTHNMPEGRRRHDADVRDAGARRSTRRRSTPSCRSARRGSPRWSSCSRTPSAP